VKAMLNWCALFTRFRKEHQVAEILAGKGIETYVPAIAVHTRRQGRVKRAFFPRYAFARIDFETVGISAVIWTPGLTNLVNFNDELAIVPDSILQRLKERLPDPDQSDPDRMFKPGDRVLVLDGPFKDFEAVFDKTLSGTDRVQILLDVLGKSARYKIGAQQITRVDYDF
jgi:transcriptional antiterminator RfaH